MGREAGGGLFSFSDAKEEAVLGAAARAAAKRAASGMGGVEGGPSCMYSKRERAQEGGQRDRRGGRPVRPPTNPAHRLGATSALAVRFSGGGSDW